MQHLIVDLETCAIDDVETYLEPQSAPANYKDPEKIAAYIAQANLEAADRAALDPDLCRIAAIGFYTGNQPVVLPCRNEQEEKEALQGLWAVYSLLDRSYDHGKIVVFNGLAFDLPVVLARSWYLSVPAPAIQIDKFRHPGVIDLAQLRSFNGATKMHSLSFYCNRLKLGPFDDDVEGKEIPALVREGSEASWTKILRHCEADVRRTYALAMRMGVV